MKTNREIAINVIPPAAFGAKRIGRWHPENNPFAEAIRKAIPDCEFAATYFLSKFKDQPNEGFAYILVIRSTDGNWYSFKLPKKISSDIGLYEWEGILNRNPKTGLLEFTLSFS